jgi:hypothetical protein
MRVIAHLTGERRLIGEPAERPLRAPGEDEALDEHVVAEPRGRARPRAWRPRDRSRASSRRASSRHRSPRRLRRSFHRRAAMQWM